MANLARSPNGNTTGAELKQRFPDEGALHTTLTMLTRREIISHSDDSYRITVPLVAAYVRTQAA